VPLTELRLNYPKPVIGVKKQVGSRTGSREGKLGDDFYQIIGNQIL